MTRSVFGEPVSVVPMSEGKMGPAGADPARPVHHDVLARFDMLPDLEQLVNTRGSEVAVAAELCTASFAVGAISFELRIADRIVRRATSTASTETYRVTRLARLPLGVTLAYLSRI